MSRRVALKSVSGDLPEQGSAHLTKTGSVISLDLVQLRQTLERSIGEGAMVVWFGEGIEFLADVDLRRLTVIVPTNFFRDRISSRFGKALVESVETVSGTKGWEIQIHVSGEPPAEDATDSESGISNPENPAVSSAVNVEPPLDFMLQNAPVAQKSRTGRSGQKNQKSAWPTDPKMTSSGQMPGLFGDVPIKASRRLDNFVVGACNRLAHTAALEMIKSRGEAFNPLVLHGGVGLGKTHILDGVAFAVRTTPAASGRIIHVTAEEFTNAFLEAIRTGQLASFRNRFRHAAALVMDDVHFLAAKRATQNEFLHTFDALMAENVPIVLSCDQHPKRINRLTEELSTRFMAGMVIRLDTPDPDVRRLILRTKASARGVALPDNVVEFLGEQLRVSVRELEGALNSLIAHSVLTGRRIDLDLARMVLRDSIRHTVQSIGIAEVESAVCQVFSLTREQIHGRNGSHQVSLLRTLAMYLSRRHTSASYSEIARHFGLKNHSSVIAAEKRVRQNLDQGGNHRTIAGFDNLADMVAAVQISLGV